MPAISVIIPVYNVEKYLRRCLNSLLNQTFTDWEAICVNDGSPDNSLAILKEFAERDSRFKIVDKENGGLSDARNAGMAVATGEYILFVDSDDFIHPQTMEITHFLAKRDKSDIVSFTYDRLYRPSLMIRYKLGLNIDNIIPSRYYKKYKIAHLDTLVTDDIYAYATEKSKRFWSPKKKWMIKHCQVWKNLYKRDLIKDIPFIKGLLFEDVPWWSEVMLHNPKVTIAPIPLYFYVPNFGGIVLSAKQLKILQNLCAGLKYSYLLYKKNATEYQMKQWSLNFRWHFIKAAFRKIKYLDNDTDMEIAKQCFIDLEKNGVLDRAYRNWARKIRKEVCSFIKCCKER